MPEYESCKHLPPSDRRAIIGLFILWLGPMIVCYRVFGGDVWLSRLVTVTTAVFFLGAFAAIADARWEASHRRRDRKTVRRLTGARPTGHPAP